MRIIQRTFSVNKRLLMASGKGINGVQATTIRNPSLLKYTQYRNSSTLVEKTNLDKIVDVVISDCYIHMKWNDNTCSKFPYIFLRDNCQCSTCFQQSSQSRSLNFAVEEIDPDIQSDDVRHDVDENSVIVTWPDGHRSMFKGDWLKERSFLNSWDDAKPLALYGMKEITWTGSYMADNLPFVDYHDLMTSEKAVIAYLENLFIYGLSIVKNAPKQSGLLYDIPKRVAYGYVKNTPHGDLHTVKYIPSPFFIANTAVDLPLHMDLPSMMYNPGIQLFHCIEQTEEENAGTSVLSDGFRSAEQLKETNPHFFDLLTKVKFTFHHEGSDKFGEFDLQFERPIIGLDSFGIIESVSMSDIARSSYINAPANDIIEIYKAFYTLKDILKRNILEYKISPGDILCTNNRRVAHGRKSYDVTKTNRWLEVIYLDADELYSKYRVMRKRE